MRCGSAGVRIHNNQIRKHTDRSTIYSHAQLCGPFFKNLVTKCDSITPKAARARKHAVASIEIPGHLDSGTQQLIRRAIDDPFMSGFRCVMAIGAALAFASAVTAVVSIQRERG